LSNPPKYLPGGKGLPDEYSEFCIMRAMGWDLKTLNKQPDGFIYMISAFIAAENKARK